MRLSRNDLLKMYPSWNETKNNIVKVLYGDIPLVEWNKTEYERYRQLDSDVADISFGADAYVWTQNGDYSLYSTLIGRIAIGSSGEVLYGDLRIKNRGTLYLVHLNLMYGLNSFSVFRNNGAIDLVGFSSKDGLTSSRIKSHTNELNRYTIEEVLKTDLSDYGDSIKKFMETAAALYSKDKINYIMEKCISD